MNFIDLLCGKTGTPSTVIYPAVHQPNVEEISVQKQHLTHHKCILCVSDLPRWRPLPSQWSNKAAPQPVPGELLRGMLQATRNSVWGSAGGGEWRRGLVWPPDAHVPPKVFPAHKFCQTLTSILSPCPSTTLAYKLSTICSSHLFSLNSILHLDSPCPHAEPETAFPADDRSTHPWRQTQKGPPESQQRLTTWRLEYWFNRKRFSFAAGWTRSSKAVERKYRLSHRLSSCEEEEHLIAH